MSQLQRLPIVLVLAGALVSSGCATVKGLLPWGGNGAESAVASATTEGSSAAVTDDTADVATTGSNAGDPASRDGGSDVTTVPLADRPQARANLDLSVPASSGSTSAGVSPTSVSPIQPAPPPRDTATAIGPLTGWSATLHEAIQRNWLRPTGPQIPVAFSCEVLVKLTRSGIVEDARVTRSCGHPSLDASVISAVQAASPLPLPVDMDEFSDTLVLAFSP